MTQSRLPHLMTALLLIVTALWLWLSGRDLICPCGTIALFTNDPMSPEASQQVADWYTLSHIIHGLLFFAALWLVARRLSWGWRLTIATAIEAGWEMVENSATVIERYRQTTVSSDYNGDSVLNAVADIVAMFLGFWLAGRLPIWASVAMIIGFELFTAWLIRDGLALNVLMLLWPVQSVLEWQAAAFSTP